MKSLFLDDLNQELKDRSNSLQQQKMDTKNYK